MALQGIRQGELAYWLDVIAAGPSPRVEGEPSAADAPAHIIEALEVLSCIRRQDGVWTITEKGRLSLRMADPAAIHLR